MFNKTLFCVCILWCNWLTIQRCSMPLGFTICGWELTSHHSVSQTVKNLANDLKRWFHQYFVVIFITPPPNRPRLYFCKKKLSSTRYHTIAFTLFWNGKMEILSLSIDVRLVKWLCHSLYLWLISWHKAEGILHTGVFIEWSESVFIYLGVHLSCTPILMFILVRWVFTIQWYQCFPWI